MITILVLIALSWLNAGASAATDNITRIIPRAGALTIEACRPVVSQGGESCEGQFLLAAEGGASSLFADGISSPLRTVNVPTRWRSFARGNGVIVAVDCRGRVQTSLDDENWISRDARIPFALHSVAFGHGRFVAVGNEGTIVTSEDGVTWTSRDAGTDERLRGVTWADGLFVAVGYAGTLLTSKNGSRWTQRESGIGRRLQAVTHGNGTFVAVGWNGVILTSAGGICWSKQNSGTDAHLHRVTCTNNVFVVPGDAGTTLISTNGTNWSCASPGPLGKRRRDAGNRSGCDRSGVAATPEINFTNLQYQVTLSPPSGNRFYRLKACESDPHSMHCLRGGPAPKPVRAMPVAPCFLKSRIG